MSEGKKFTLYWRHGKREVVSGHDVADAMTNAGYGNGALRALDFWASGEDHDWEFASRSGEWVPKPDGEFGKQLAALNAKAGA